MQTEVYNIKVLVLLGLILMSFKEAKKLNLSVFYREKNSLEDPS